MAANRPSILTVEDEQYMQDTFRMLLGDLYGLTPACNAAEAIKALATRRFDVVLLDLILPDMDGIELLRKMKAARPDLVVIVVTARTDAKSGVGAMKLGAYDYIEKPFDREQFIMTVGRAVEKFTLEKRVRSRHCMQDFSHSLEIHVAQNAGFPY